MTASRPNLFLVARARIGTRVHLRYGENREASQDWIGRLLSFEPMRDSRHRLGLKIEIRPGRWRVSAEQARQNQAWHTDWADGDTVETLHLGPFENVLVLHSKAAVEIKQPDGSVQTIPIGDRTDSRTFVLRGDRTLTIMFIDA